MGAGRGILPRGAPLVETHLHLEGSIPRRVLSRLAARQGSRLRTGPPGAGGAIQRRRGFSPFLDAFVFCASLLRTREDIEAAAGALLDDLRREGVLHAEIAFSPQVHLRRGLPLPALLEGLARAAERAAARGGPRVGWIADGGRLWGARWFEDLVEEIAVWRPAGIVAIGLGGDERAAPAARFRRAFERAARAGLGAVAHAGEGTTPREVREALALPGVRRLGHGIAAVGDPALLALIRERGVVLEVCPTSNRWTGATAGRRAPLRALLDAGVRVVLGSDDRAIFGTSLRGEFGRAASEAGIDRLEARGLLLEAAGALFATAREKAALKARIDAAFDPPRPPLRPPRPS